MLLRRRKVTTRFWRRTLFCVGGVFSFAVVDVGLGSGSLLSCILTAFHIIPSSYEGKKWFSCFCWYTVCGHLASIISSSCFSELITKCKYFKFSFIFRMLILDMFVKGSDEPSSLLNCTTDATCLLNVHSRMLLG